ncbi:MAG: anti-sigma factor family protein [Heteroscytonema crispum UTEX LB 1556]
MTTDYSQFNDCSPLQLHQDLSGGMAEHTNDSTGAMDMVKRDRFELLSAYLDGEVTAAERRQVEEWLSNDPTIQPLYARLLKIRQGLRTLPVPQQPPIEETVQQVFARLRRRSRYLALSGGAAIAAIVIGAVSGIFTGGDSPAPQLAKHTTEPTQTTPAPVSAAPLMVAINNSVFPIPKTAEATPNNPVDLEQPKSRDTEHDVN